LTCNPQQDCCTTLGGSKFNALAATNQPVNRTSFGDAGRHGTSNTWAKWSQKPKSLGIASRSPYGKPRTSKKNIQTATQHLGGRNTHYTGLGVGAHGHGIGVVPASIGGPHAKTRTTLKVVKPTAQPSAQAASVIAVAKPSEGKTAQTAFCKKCFFTWATVGAVAFVLVLAGVTS
jgi:hypothetical protein